MFGLKRSAAVGLWLSMLALAGCAPGPTGGAASAPTLPATIPAAATEATAAPIATAAPEATAAPTATATATATPEATPAPTATPGAASGASVPLAESELPPAALNVRQVLAQQLHVEPQSVAVLEAQPMDWSDSCLGAGLANEMCAAVITPGYQITLEANGARYVYRTDAQGGYFRMVEAPTSNIGTQVITWLGTDDTGDCGTAAVGTEGIAFGRCYDPVVMTVPLTFSGRNDDLAALRAAYAPFTATTAVGDVIFAGEGAQEATPAAQRMIAERARNAFFEARAGRSSAGLGLALAVYQQGGIAARCSNVSVYRTGVAYVADCAAQPPITLPAVLLDSAQLGQVYAWTDSLQGFESSRTDGAADVMTTTVTFFGTAEGQATDADKQAMEALAAELAAQAQAAQVDKAPGQDFSRVVFVAHGDTLLKLAFIPADPALIGYAGMEQQYGIAMQSLAFFA